MTLTIVQGGMHQFEKTGNYTVFLVFYSSKHKRSWRIKLRNKEQFGTLKINREPEYEYHYLNEECWIRKINNPIFSRIENYSFIMQD